MEIAQGINGVLPETGGQKNTETLREMLQLEINSAMENGKRLFERELGIKQTVNGCRRRLRQIENLDDPGSAVCFEATDLTDFFTNICSACDLALCGTGRHIIFSGSAGAAFICRETVMRQCLNMISNAAVHSGSELITARLTHTAHCAVFSVCAEGHADLSSVCGSTLVRGSGMWYIANTAFSHGTSAMMCVHGGETRASIGIKTSPVVPVKPVRDFTSLLCDRLSPVYTQLSTVEGI